MSEGWVKLHRKLLDNPVSAKMPYLALWVYLLMKANYITGSVIVKGKKIVIEPGMYFGSIKKLAEHFGVSKSTIHALLTYYEKESMIERNKNGDFTLITIKNWCDYQESERNANGKRTESETIKEYKKEKKERNIYTANADSSGLFDLVSTDGPTQPKASTRKPTPKDELISLAAEMQGIKQFTNYAKQLRAISLIEKAGHTLDDIRFVVEEMGKEDYWKLNVFDLMNVYNNMDKYLNRTVMYKEKGGKKWSTKT